MHDLPRDALRVELTESFVLRRPEAAREAMMELREQGVRIPIDDFGTRFASPSEAGPSARKAAGSASDQCADDPAQRSGK